LPSQAQGLGLQVPLVNLENQAYGNQPTIGAVLITEALFNQIDQNSITVLESQTKPSPSFFIDIGLGLTPPSNTARGLPELDNDGTIGGLPLQQDERARFVSTADYGSLGSNNTLLKSFWLVPSATLAPTALTNRAGIIGRQLKNLLNMLSQTPEQEFERAGLSFANNTSKGLGDIGLKLYALYRCTKNSAVQFSTGFLLPSADSLNEKESAILFMLSKGSNGHAQPFFQTNFIHSVNDWFSYGIGCLLSCALPASEYIPASFEGAFVKNCGPLTRADISWLTSIFQAQGSWYVPLESGYKPYFAAAYQWYYKSEDHISFVYQNAFDWAGNFYPLSSAVAQKNSNSSAHFCTISGGVTLKSYGVLECGWQGIIAGFNTVRTHGWTARFSFIF
jgi:hypothetical protein